MKGAALAASVLIAVAVLMLVEAMSGDEEPAAPDIVVDNTESPHLDAKAGGDRAREGQSMGGGATRTAADEADAFARLSVPTRSTASFDPTSLGSIGSGRFGARGKNPIARKEAVTDFDVEIAQAAVIVDRLNTEAYDHRTENPFLAAVDSPLSTFSADVDTASYANIRRFLNQGSRPPAGAVRVEEMINYFTYGDARPDGEHPLAISTELATCPWNLDHLLLRIGIAARDIDQADRPLSNIVLLIDSSGSMTSAAKLPLLKRGLGLLVEQLGENDMVSIVTYAGTTRTVLGPTPGDRRELILSSVEQLRAGGSTDGADGIQMAYDAARNAFITGGTNRVILCTDGDFNVGITDRSELVRMIQKEAKSGVFLSVLGFGSGNLKDATMEDLADKGNGNYSYIDSVAEARKVLVEQMGSTLITVAKDVKLQVEFNPLKVASYRLIGYENRLLRNRDFADDKIDAGEIGAGHTVTALYEIVPATTGDETVGKIDMRYTHRGVPTALARSDEILNVAVRYKLPAEDTSTRLDHPVKDRRSSFDAASTDLRFAAAVASFGMLLRDAPDRGDATVEMIQELARSALGEDKGGYRAGFLELLSKASKQ